MNSFKLSEKIVLNNFSCLINPFAACMRYIRGALARNEIISLQPRPHNCCNFRFLFIKLLSILGVLVLYRTHVTGLGVSIFSSVKLYFLGLDYYYNPGLKLNLVF